MSRPVDKPKIPDKLFFKIGEVAAIAETKPHVLRYWETEFGILRPVKNASGQRVYRRRDVEVVLEIKRLLHEERFTIAGAKKRLSGRRSVKSRTPEAEETQIALPATAEPRGPGDISEALKELEKGLREILSILDKTDRELENQ
jgi:DNA-binding transcriptional MerR regulator